MVQNFIQKLFLLCEIVEEENLVSRNKCEAGKQSYSLNEQSGFVLFAWFSIFMHGNMLNTK